MAIRNIPVNSSKKNKESFIICEFEDNDKNPSSKHFHLNENELKNAAEKIEKKTLKK